MKSGRVRVKGVASGDHEMMSKIASYYGFGITESDGAWVFENEYAQLKLKKTDDCLLDADRARDGIERLLEYGNGYVDSGSGYFGGPDGEPYCEYKIMDLNDRGLQQKTDKGAEIGNRHKRQRFLHVGDFIEGKSKKTGETYHGYIVRFVRDSYNDIITVYVMALGIGRFVALDPTTVNLASPLPVYHHRPWMLDSGNIITQGLINYVGGKSS